MATSLKFYCDLLGFEIHASDQNTTRPDHNWVWLVRGGEIHLMLNTAYDPGRRPSRPDPRRAADYHDTCLYFEEPHIATYGMKQLYLRDPDG